MKRNVNTGETRSASHLHLAFRASHHRDSSGLVNSPQASAIIAAWPPYPEWAMRPKMVRPQAWCMRNSGSGSRTSM